MRIELKAHEIEKKRREDEEEKDKNHRMTMEKLDETKRLNEHLKASETQLRNTVAALREQVLFLKTQSRYAKDLDISLFDNGEEVAKDKTANTRPTNPAELRVTAPSVLQEEIAREDNQLRSQLRTANQGVIDKDKMLENQQHANEIPKEQLEKAKEATEEARPNSPLLREEVEFLHEEVQMAETIWVDSARQVEEAQVQVMATTIDGLAIMDELRIARETVSQKQKIIRNQERRIASLDRQLHTFGVLPDQLQVKNDRLKAIRDRQIDFDIKLTHDNDSLLRNAEALQNELAQAERSVDEMRIEARNRDDRNADLLQEIERLRNHIAAVPQDIEANTQVGPIASSLGK
jgi:hypothetical protein